MPSTSSRVSRRRILKTAGAAAVGGGAALLANGVAAQGQAPAILTNTQAGRRFKAFIKYNSADLPGVVDVTARALSGNQVLLRVEAAQTCYTSIDQVLIPGTPTGQATIVGHGGVGIVEAIGPQVISARIGDRVILNLHAACGRCYNCLRMRSDKCRTGAASNAPIADANGMPVFGRTGAMSELAITGEEYVTPLFTDVSSVEIAMLTCVSGCGLGMTMTNAPVEVASDVVIFGAGPVGLSAVMGARVKGASRIIVVEPIPYRRELALKLGATDVVDPNQFKDRAPIPNAPANGDRFRDALVEHLREMTQYKYADRVWSGGGRNGPDHVIEAAGGDKMKPRRLPQGPDPTGITVLNQCWELGSSIGSIVTCGVGHPSDAFVRLPASQWADGAKHHWPGTGGGTNDRRDSQRYCRLMETGQINIKAIASRTYPLSQTREAYQVCADRDVVATIVTPNVRA
jgi:S-(hydroxymethyl)glutathione dehydrogenase/alcohol dehydrogenase